MSTPARMSRLARKVQPPLNVAERRERDTLAKEQCAERPLGSSRPVKLKTTTERLRVWVAWESFIRDVDGSGANPEEYMFDLCRGGLRAQRAQDAIRRFLKDYVESNVRQRACLGEQEYRTIRTVNHAVSVRSNLQLLVSHADACVLSKKRDSEPEQRTFWRLVWGLNGPKKIGPIYDLCRWIEEEFAETHDLSLEQLQPKHEATEDDILLVISTLWERPDLIPCDPDIRVSFHAALLLAGIGFRPGTVVELPYKQVEPAIVRDPDNPGKSILLITITILQNKRKEKVIKTSQDHIVQFHVPLVPCQALCITSLMLARAISEDAFEPSFTSIDELLRRPQLENADYLPLRWKESAAECPLLKITYPQFWQIWTRAIWVCGFMDHLVPYSLRRGGGGRLDESAISPSLRNWILSHTSRVFLKSYQPNRLREHVVRLSYRDRVPDDSELFKRLRNASLRRDPNAPIDPSPEEIKEFDQHSGMRELFAEHAAAKNAAARSRVSADIQHLRETLTRDKARSNRKKYLKEAQDRRASGLPTASLQSRPAMDLSPLAAQGAKAVGEFIKLPAEGIRSKSYINILLAYVRFRPLEVVALVAQEAGWPLTESLLPKNDTKMPVCLLGCGSFSTRTNLTRHCRNYHLTRGTFDQPFQCPHCLLTGRSEHAAVVSSPAGWSNHIARFHIQKDTPYLPSDHTKSVPKAPQPRKLAVPAFRCLLCDRCFPRGKSLSQHITLSHVQKRQFDNPFPCPECQRQGKESFLVADYEAWELHLSDFHAEAGKLGTPQEDSLVSPASHATVSYTASPEADDDVPIDPALRSLWQPDYDTETYCNAFPSPSDGTSPITPSSNSTVGFTSPSSEYPNSVQPTGGSPPSKEAVPLNCFICEGDFSRHVRGIHRHYNSTHAKEIASGQPFSCLVCSRLGIAEDKLLVGSIDALLHHMTIQHQHPRLTRCPFCNLIFSERGANTHIQKHFSGSEVLECLMCCREAQADPSYFNDYTSWYIHAQKAHRWFADPSQPVAAHFDTQVGVKRLATDVDAHTPAKRRLVEAVDEFQVLLAGLTVPKSTGEEATR